MLFALDWFKRTLGSIVSAIRALTDGLDLFLISSALREFWLVAVASAIAGVVLCFLGFRYHKVVHGLIGSALFGRLGWHIAQMLGSTQITALVVYATLFAIVGFFVMYICYFLNVFAGSYLLLLALFAPVSSLFKGYTLAAFLLGIICCVLYVKYKLDATALSGAMILSLMFFGISPALSLIILGSLTFAGIYVQGIVRCRYEDLMKISMQKQIEKYPYGPGLAYGWEDPTVSHSQKK